MADETRLEQFLTLCETFPATYDAGVYGTPAAAGMLAFLDGITGQEITILCQQLEGNDQAIKIVAYYITQKIKMASDDEFREYFAMQGGAAAAAESSTSAPVPVPVPTINNKPAAPASAEEIAIVKQPRKPRAKKAAAAAK